MAKKNKVLLYSLLALVVVLLIYVSIPSISGNAFALTGNVLTLNLVPNPSFETSDPISYALPLGYSFLGTDATHVAAVDSIGHTGSKSIHMIVNSSTKVYYNIASTNKINVTGGKTYLIEMWVKSKNLPASTGLWNGTGGYPDKMYMEFREYLANDTQQTSYNSIGYYGCGGNSPTSSYCGNNMYSFDGNRNKDWQKVYKYYKMQAGTSYIIPKFYLYTTNGEVWFDDFRISELEDSPTQYITNPSFEIWNNPYGDSTPTGNSIYDSALGWYAGQGGGIISRSSDAVDGQYSFNLTAGLVQSTCTNACTWNHTYLAQDANYLQIGRKYSASAYIKSQDKVLFHVQRTNWTLGGDSGSISYNGGNTWQKVSVDFIATGSSTHRLVFENPVGIGKSFLVDKVEIKDKGLATTCTLNTQCASSELCSTGYCSQVSCLSGYHGENHLCVKDPIDCAAGSHYDANTQNCVVNKTPLISNKMIIQIALVIIAALLIFLIFRKK